MATREYAVCANVWLSHATRDRAAKGWWKRGNGAEYEMLNQAGAGSGL
jgi:hypothetical protein